ncbi:hypothetical protein [Rhizobium leguminosarum]|uniref:hypothetical protein n=1 Tax=Rhizobium leguminosarum TaxID=384 RepID=UPI001FE1AF02|nr:hypothetical protein [Rhizobium leguminosarum]
MVAAALQGYGIAVVPESYVETHFAGGRLQLFLEDWTPKSTGLPWNCPAGQYVPKAFVGRLRR